MTRRGWNKTAPGRSFQPEQVAGRIVPEWLQAATRRVSFLDQRERNFFCNKRNCSGVVKGVDKRGWKMHVKDTTTNLELSDPRRAARSECRGPVATEEPHRTRTPLLPVKLKCVTVLARADTIRRPDSSTNRPNEKPNLSARSSFSALCLNALSSAHEQSRFERPLHAVLVGCFAISLAGCLWNLQQLTAHWTALTQLMQTILS